MQKWKLATLAQRYREHKRAAGASADVADGSRAPRGIDAVKDTDRGQEDPGVKMGKSATSDGKNSRFSRRRRLAFIPL
jgi:hypothetical protein